VFKTRKNRGVWKDPQPLKGRKIKAPASFSKEGGHQADKRFAEIGRAEGKGEEVVGSRRGKEFVERSAICTCRDRSVGRTPKGGSEERIRTGGRVDCNHAEGRGSSKKKRREGRNIDMRGSR